MVSTSVFGGRYCAAATITTTAQIGVQLKKAYHCFLSSGLRPFNRYCVISKSNEYDITSIVKPKKI